jgi:hypothetical protein
MPAEALLFDLELFLTDSRSSLRRIHLRRSGTMHDSDQSRFVSHERFFSTVPRANTLIRKETMICVGPVSLERVRRWMLKLDQTGTESIPIGEM